MSNIICPQCKTELPAGTAVCTNCGFDIQRAARRGATIAMIISAAIILGLCFLLSGVIQGLFR